ncbi:MAG: sigma 54-interacting transcriptional regulator [Gemmataceae bacterium]
MSSSNRIRFVNTAWETLTKVPATEAVGHACLRRGPTTDLFRALAPTAEASAGRIATVRRAVPPKSLGPPWWDVTFVPLLTAEGIGGYLGLIAVVPVDSPSTKASVPAEAGAVREAHSRAFSIDLVSGQGPNAERFTNQIRHAAQSTAPVWLIGEAGSGKETVARVIHHTGPYRNRAFFGVDCAGIPWFQLETTLFGRGSLGESERLGTLYLKNPAALPRDSQRFLTSWLAGPGKSVRLVSGSSESASTAVASGRLVPEFQSHFSLLEIPVPALRERKSELPRIVERILTRCPAIKDQPASITNEAMDVLLHYTWPGNLRELNDVLFAAAKDGAITPERLPRVLREKSTLASHPPARNEPGPVLDDVLADVEKRLLAVALEKTNGNATKAAEWLGIARTRFLRRAEAFGLKKGDES